MGASMGASMGENMGESIRESTGEREHWKWERSGREERCYYHQAIPFFFSFFRSLTTPAHDRSNPQSPNPLKSHSQQ